MPTTDASSAAASAASAPSFAASAAASSAPADPYLWLEDVLGDKALAWVRERNAASRRVLEARPEYAPTRTRVLEVLNSRERIPTVARGGDFLYNFWQDDAHKRGLWRRTSLQEYRKPQPQWEILLDIDALGAAEKENWVFAGVDRFEPNATRCLVMLSRGGADAHVVREFDMRSKTFVKDGFTLPEAKSDVSWVDADTLFVGTDFGPGSLTDSGYPRIVKRWRRGTPLSAAETVFEAGKTDISGSGAVDRTPGHERILFVRSIDFYNTEVFLLRGGALMRIDKPTDASISFWRNRLLVELRSDWTVGGKTWPRGSLLVTDADAYLAGQRRFDALFTPTASRSLAGYAITLSTVLVNVLDNVASRLEEWRPQAGSWQHRDVKAPFPGTLSVAALHDDFVANDPLAESYLVNYTDFLTPDSLMLGKTGSDERELLKSRPRFFDASGMRVEQHFVASKDGTRIPYFVVWPKGAKEDGANPTLLTGYGGFEVPNQPFYSGSVGRAWHERGGVLVEANIRGGGEYGPGWHQAAILANKQRSYDDFIAVAEDVIRRRISSPQHLGIQGGSNGGLLVGAVMVQRPDLFNAVVCQVPLLDMRRYHLLLAGASWMAEYGNPDDPKQWDFISRYSPYQNVKAGVRYPRVFFTTSTRDDRVHPGHARKMAARMLEQGHELLYYENIEGGHGGAADNEQRADVIGLEYAYLWMQLGGKTS
jgi:prolyl oligopeptidase